MSTVAENQEISRSVYTSEDIFRASFYETLDSRTISSLDLLKDTMHWNFIQKRRKLDSSRNFHSNENSQDLSNQNDVLKSKLPVYFNANKDKILSIINETKQKYDFDFNKIENHINILTDNISELNFNDIYVEITKSNLIKFTTLFGEDKILIISKDFTTNDNDIIYSYFINSQMIAADVFEISSFIKKFKEYISL